MTSLFSSSPAVPTLDDRRLPGVLSLELSRIIENRIIYLELSPDAHLTEQELCDEFSISRSPVREAFRQLEADGLVIRHARRGVRIAPMTETALAEIYSCRIPLENVAAVTAAREASPAQIALLEQIVDRLDELHGAADTRQFFSQNLAFFNAIHTISGNVMLQGLLQTLGKQVMRYRYYAHVRNPDMARLSQTGLRGILDAIKARNPLAARRTTTRVLQNAQQLIIAALNDKTN